MEFNETITFLGGINTDDTPQNMPKGDYRDFSYCRLGYNDGNAYAVTTSNGTLVIPNPIIEIQDQIIGATPWQKTNSIVYFVFKASLVHEIWVYDITNQTHTLAVQGSELNFSRDWPIFHSNVIDDILKWTDGRWDSQMYEDDGTRLFNPPYQINLQKALDGYYSVFDLQTIDAIKWPMDPPVVGYFTDTTRNDNKLRNKLFKFIIQPIYENGEVGVWSMYSNLELPELSEFVSGTNWIFPNNSNGIRIQFNTGSNIIRKFNIAVQQFDKDSLVSEPPFGVFLQLDKDQDVIADNTVHFVNFYGGVATSPAVDVFKNYDRLPITADCQEYLPTNQLTYINFREGYDKPVEEPFILDVGMSYLLNEVSWNPYLYPLAISFDLPAFAGTWRLQNLTGQANVAFLFNAGQVFQFTNPLGSTIGYCLSFEEIQGAINSSVNVEDQNIFIFNILGDFIANSLGTPTGSATVPSAGFIWYTAPWIGGYDPIEFADVSPDAQTLATPSLKSGATHEFGIVYGDRAYRDSTVYTVDSMNLFVPWFYDIDRSGLSNPENPFTISPQITINHIPPIWATKYWIVCKPSTEISSFGQYTTNARDSEVSFLSSITLDDVTRNRYKIQIDNYYENQNLGATIRHQIQIGDKLRFIRRRNLTYLPYLELDIIDYDPVGGNNGRAVVYTNLFDTTLIDNDTASVSDELFGQLVEIYTPRPSIDDTGSIFISAWKDVTPSINIRSPHTENRAHNVPPLYYIYVLETSPGVYRFAANGDYSFLIGQTFGYTRYNDDGTTFSANTVVINAVYSTVLNVTTFTLTFPALPSIYYITFDTNATSIRQVVTALNSTTAALFTINYGDVYLKRRDYANGVSPVTDEGSGNYYYIEDRNYSDYWISDIHNAGRVRIEDPNAKMTHRQATAIHSDSFIVGTQINGLSSFGLDNQNIEDMNPVFGPVIRAFMSGREGKTLKCIQPKKENSIYIQYYPNEVGSDSTVRVSNTTFASWFDYKSLLGCTNAGATAILPNGSTIYFDNNSGVFVYSGANGQIQISEIDPDSGKDYKFRTKTKSLAAAYNASTAPMVRTYVNESIGEVGFAFRFDTPYTGTAYGRFNPAVGITQEVWSTGTFDDIGYLFGQTIVIVHENGAVYSGVVDFIGVQDTGPAYSVFSLDTGGPSNSEYLIPAYYYTTSNMSYDHVVFDYVNMRWRSTYDYNFQQFCNLGQTLVGWGIDNQTYLHNQPNEWNFHGDSFVQRVSFVSNENPLALKRYQDITLVSDDLFSIEARSEPNRSYPLGMKTTMPTNLISTYEGYGKVNYRRNLYDPKFFNNNNISSSFYLPPTQPVNGWTLDFDQSTLLNELITIIQADGSIFTGIVTLATYDTVNDWTLITLQDQQPNTNGALGNWYLSERALCNGQDIRANALTHTLEYDPAINNTSSILVSVGIKGVLS
jgi:hypothetical protein